MPKKPLLLKTCCHITLSFSKTIKNGTSLCSGGLPAFPLLSLTFSISGVKNPQFRDSEELTQLVVAWKIACNFVNLQMFFEFFSLQINVINMFMFFYIDPKTFQTCRKSVDVYNTVERIMWPNVQIMYWRTSDIKMFS